MAHHRHRIPFGGDYHAFRRLLARLALEWGMSADRTDDLVLAANEVVTNAVLHGEPPIEARCWVADGDFVCEISDGGAGIADPSAGATPPAPNAQGRWGLVLARRICDALEIAAGRSGSRVRLYVGLDSAARS